MQLTAMSSESYVQAVGSDHNVEEQDIEEGDIDKLVSDVKEEIDQVKNSL